ncbi:MAG: phosphoribosyl isomerase [Micromonosporaceae bacterium]|nr:phosphoribosyl isomerase [Micromonosporaceae bacterium]
MSGCGRRGDTQVALTLLPAVDIADGRAVRFTGDGPTDPDPMATARAWLQDGARWLHLVDLDAAFRRGDNAALITAMIGALDARIELSAGVCDDESLRWAMSTGAARISLSSAALADLDWCVAACGRYGDRLAVALDVHNGRIAPRGFAGDAGGLDLFTTLDRLDRAGCARYLVTDVTRDGTLTGPNLALLREVCGFTAQPVVASGGVAGLDDLGQLATLEPAGLEGVIVGRALGVGAFTVAAALAALDRSATRA